ncbi:MAG: hypothetical protein JNL30_06040 [Rubrivivax sp.]|nr:hypothetical protein [Rubrivivax sp.]
MRHPITRRSAAKLPRAARLAAAALVLAGCSGSESDGDLKFNAVATTASKPALFVFFDSDADGTGDSIARIDLDTDAVDKTNVVGVSGSGGTHKQAFYEGPIWVGSGPLVWAIDPTSLEVIPRPNVPLVQGNREGTITSALISGNRAFAMSLAQEAAAERAKASVLPTEKARLRSYFDRTSLTYEEARSIDMCEVRASRSGINSKVSDRVFAAAIQVASPFHNMGYSPVGIEPGPDGKLTMFAVRQGDHTFFLDTDPKSPNFGLPVRFVYPRLGVVKDQTGNVVSNFAGAYTSAGGTAPGRTHYNRVATGTSEADKNTYTEPCDSTALINASGVMWSWWPDVNGDTITGVNMSTVASTAPQVVQIRVPVITRSTAPAAAGGFGSAAFTASRQRTGPWMASLLNRNVGNEFLFTVENEGDNSESIWDVTSAANVFEVQRIVTNLKHVLAADIGAAPFVAGTTYVVNVSHANTGGAVTPVNYVYVSLAADDLSGVSADVTRAYLRKATATDPGPNFILNGLNGRAGTSEANVVRRQGSGANAILFSDEVWLLTGTGFGAIDGFQILDLTGIGPPYRIKETVALPSAFAGSFSPDGKKFYQLRAGNVDVIDSQTRKLVNVIALPGTATGIAFASYQAASTGSGGSGGSGGGGGGGGGSGGGGGGVCNPCGGCKPVASKPD